MTKNQYFHLVEVSPWPIVSSLGALSVVLGGVSALQFKSEKLLVFIFLMLSATGFIWWYDVSREASSEGLHGKQVMSGLKMGMILFITSEVMFFFSFFWAFFQSSIAPNIEIGEGWPPKSLFPFNPMNIPLINTLILLTSGVTVTWAHHLILSNNYKSGDLLLGGTVGLGIAFSLLQGLEYEEAPFSFADSSYGSAFFLATGFHGLHVLIGSIFLSVVFIILKKRTFSEVHIVGFEAAAWYWHFVDVVWIFLYSSIYWWGI